MTRSPSTVGLLSAVLALASIAHAQNVWVVAPAPGPGVDFTQIHAAVAAASSGDLVLVKAGSYDAFDLVSKSLVVEAALGAVVNVKRFTIQSLGAGQQAVIRGLNVGMPSHLAAAEIQDAAGSVWIENCNLNGANGGPTGPVPGPQDSGWPALVIQNSASVVLHNVAARGGAGPSTSNESVLWNPGSGGHGITCESSSVWAYDCVFDGGPGGFMEDVGCGFNVCGDGGSGAVLDASFLFASGSSFTGDHGGDGWCDLVFCGFSEVLKCANPGDGGHGLWLKANAPSAVSLDCAFTGAPQGTGGAPPAQPGVPVKTDAGSFQTLPGLHRSYSASSPAKELQSATLRFTAPAGDLAFFLYGAVPDALPLLFLGGALHLSAASGIEAIGFGAVPASGILVAALPIPALPASVEGLSFCTQSVFLSGGSPVLGPPASLLLLDASL